MDCREFDERLDALLEGGLVASEREALAAHAAGCPRCGRLLALLSSELDVAPVEAPEGLAEGVLARTTGAPCARAQELACDLADGALEPSEAEIARLHLDHCPECGPVARALARLREDLPALAEATPGAGFLEGVLARTSRSWPRRMGRWHDRTAAAWRRILVRPRFAAEGAYLGSLVLTVLVAVPGSPLHRLPQRALVVARAPIVAPASALEEPVAELRTRAAALELRARESLGRRLAAPVERLKRRTDEAAGAFRALGSQLAALLSDAGRDGGTSTTQTTTRSDKEGKEKKP